MHEPDRIGGVREHPQGEDPRPQPLEAALAPTYRFGMTDTDDQTPRDDDSTEGRDRLEDRDTAEIEAHGFENEPGDTDQQLSTDRASGNEIDDEDFASQLVTNDAVAGETVLGETDESAEGGEAGPLYNERAAANDGYLAPTSVPDETVRLLADDDTVDGALSPGGTATGAATSDDPTVGGRTT